MALLLLAAGCYRPNAAAGLPCSPTGECPEGQECAPDQTCQLRGSSIDGSPSQEDAMPATPDAMQIPLEPWLITEISLGLTAE
jgi:hypothetical protein